MINNISRFRIVPFDNSKKKHLQILHSDFDDGYIACHYDTKIVIIYDSHEGNHNANIQNLNGEIRVFMDRLFFFHDFQNNSIS